MDGGEQHIQQPTLWQSAATAAACGQPSAASEFPALAAASSARAAAHHLLSHCRLLRRVFPAEVLHIAKYRPREANISKHAQLLLFANSATQQVIYNCTSREWTIVHKLILNNRLPNIKTEPLEGLTENELIHLVKGFKSLDKEDQHELINYMKKLERSDPAMVQRVKIGMQS